jgi:hypothetical protein
VGHLVRKEVGCAVRTFDCPPSAMHQKEFSMRKQVIALLFVLSFSSIAFSQTPKLGFQPIVNEVSVYQNYLDDGDNAGQTLQVIAINSVRVFTELKIELTADFNRKLTPGYNTEYYMEIGIVKEIHKRISLNVQRIYGTFVTRRINQFGVRFSF